MPQADKLIDLTAVSASPTPSTGSNLGVAQKFLDRLEGGGTGGPHGGGGPTNDGSSSLIASLQAEVAALKASKNQETPDPTGSNVGNGGAPENKVGDTTQPERTNGENGLAKSEAKERTSPSEGWDKELDPAISGAIMEILGKLDAPSLHRVILALETTNIGKAIASLRGETGVSDELREGCNSILSVIGADDGDEAKD